MKTRSVRSLSILAALAGIGFLGMPTPAQASLTVTVSIGSFSTSFSGTGSASQTFTTLTDGTTTFNNITISATDNVPGDPIANQGSLAQTSVTSSSSTGTELLKVVVAESSAYSIPGAGSLILTSNISRSDGQTSDPLTFQSLVSTTSNSSGFSGPAIQTQNTTLGNNVAPNQVTYGFTSSGSYWLQNTLTVQAQTGSLNVNGTTTVTATPEPSTVALAAAGLPILGLLWARRRRANA